ncbi:MAG: restriction endonuclease subunit S [Dokdonella sp.]
MSNELPAGWVLAQIPDLIGPRGIFTDGDWVESKDQDPNGDVRLVQLADIGDGRYINKSRRFLTKSAAARLGCTFLSQGDVLVARMPDPLGRACIFPGDEKKSVTVVDVCVVRGEVDHVDHRWLMHFINSPALRAKIDALQSGSTRKRISRGNLSTIPLPIPPRSEQTRIAEKLEELLSDLDAGVAELKAAQRKLTQYRQSLLKAAVEGALTADWRAARAASGEPHETGADLLQRILTERRARWAAKQLAKFAEQDKTSPKDWQTKYSDPVAPDVPDLPALPNGWVWASIEQISADERYSLAIGPFGSNLTVADYRENGVPLVFVRNIRSRRYGGAETRFVTEEKAETLKAHQVNAGDVLVTKMGEPPGDADVYPNDQPMAVITADCIKIRCQDRLMLAQFLAAAVNSPIGRKQIGPMTQGVAQKKVSLGRFSSLAIPLPPIDEQAQVVDRLLASLIEADAQDRVFELGLRQSAAQRKNILKAAFAGQLVPQDPNDEPASELLARIRAARKVKESGESTSSKRGRKARESA